MANHVDNRVVQMQFDNSRFEKNIQTSINSLDKFKKSLNFDGASQSLDQLEKSASTMDFSKMEASLAALEHRFSALGIAGMTLVTDLTRSVERAAGKITNFVKTNVLEGGWQRAANIENAKFQLEGIGVAWKDVADDIDYAVAGTAYGLDEAAQACGRLATAGIAAGDDMKKALRGISGVAAMSGSSYAEIADIFSDAASKGRVMSMELTRLEERGIAASTMLQKELGMTGDEFDKFVRKGLLDFDTFSQAMDDAFGEHAKDANKTFDGALANLRAAFKKIGAEVATPLRDYLRDLFNAIRTTVNTVKSALMPTLEDISIILYRIIHPIQEIFESATAAESIMKVIEIIKNLIGAIALPLIEVKNAFKDIFNNSAVKGATSLLDKILEFSRGLVLTGENAKNFRDTFKGVFAVIDIVAQALSAVVKAIFPASSGFGSIGAAILNFTGNIGRFIVVIDEWIKKNDIFTKGIEKLKTFVGPAFGAVAGVLTKVKDALKGFFDAFKSGLNLDSETNKFERFGRLKDILNGVGAVFKFIGEQIKKVAPLFVSIGGIIKEALEQVGRAVHQAISGNGFNGMLDLLNAFLTSGIVALVAKFMNNLEDAVGAPAKIIKKVVPFITDIQNTLKAFQMSLKADILMTIAKAVGILTLSLIGLSLIDSAKLTRNLAAVAGVIFMLVTAMESISRVLDSGFMSGKKGLSGVLENIGMSATKSANYVSLGKALVSLATAVAILSGSLIALSFVKPEKMGQALLALTVVMGELTGVMLILSNYGGKAKTSAMAMVGMGAAVAIIAGALKKLASIDPNGMTQALEAFTAIMLELGLFSVTAGQIGKGVKQAASALLTMSIALNVIALAFKQMQGLDMKQVGTALTAFGGIMAEFGVLAGAMKAFKIDNFGSVAASLIALGVALNLIASAVNSVGGMGLTDLAKGIIGLGVAMAGMVVTLSALTGVAKALGGGTMLAAAASMILLATAFDLLAPALLMLGSASLGTVVKGLIAFGGAMMVLAIAGQALVGAVGPILALGAAVLMIGGGVALAGAGIALFATALAALTAVVIGASAAIPMLASAITQFVAAAITGIGEGIITVIKLFNEAVPSLVELVKNVIVSILNAINEMVGPLAESVVLIVAAVVKILVEAVPTIVDGVLTILVGVLTAIRDHIQDIASLALEIIAEFLRGLASGIGDVIDAGMELGIAFINGLADGIENNGEAFEAAVEHLITAVLSTLEKTLPKFLSFGKDIILNIVKGIGNLALELVRFVGNIGLKILEAFGVPDDYIQMAKDFMDGFIDGLKQKWGDLINWVKDIADSVIDGFKGIFGIHSPSTVMAEIGELLDDGLAKGIKDNKGSVLDVVEEISGDVTDKFGDMKDAGIASAEEMNTDMSEEMDGLADNAEASANRAYSAWEYAMAAIRGRSVELQHTLNSLADKYEAIDKINNQVAESTEEVVEEEEDLTEATTKAGGSASKTSKEEEKLQKALEAMLKTVPVVIHEYEELYEVMYLTEEGANAGQEALEALGVSLEEFGDFYENVGKKVESALDNIFDTPKDRGFMDKDALLKNMQENYNQVSQWADTLGKLAERGLDSGLYKKLGEMGPEGYKYVHAFMEMTEDEIGQANKVWGDAAELKPAVQNRVAAGWLNTGLMATQGLAKGLEDMEEAEAQALEDGEKVVEKVNEGAGVQSPSWKTQETGMYLIQGLTMGMLDNVDQVVFAAQVIADRLITEFEVRFASERAQQLGQKLMTNIASGILLNDETLNTAMEEIVSMIILAIDNKAEQIRQNGSYICEYIVQGFRDEMDLQEGEIDSAIDTMMQFIVDSFTKSDNETIIKEKIVKWMTEVFVKEITSKKTTYKTLDEAFDKVLEHINEHLTSEDVEEMFKDIGANWVQGLINGIEEKEQDLLDKLEELGGKMEEVTKKSTGEQSPSKITEEIGEFWDEGFVIGVKKGETKIVRAIKTLGNTIKLETQGVVNKVADETGTKIFDDMAEKVNKSAKKIAASTNTVQIKKIVNDVATVFVPVSKMAGDAADNVGKAIQKIKINVGDGTKSVNQQINQAIKFVKNLNTDLMSLDGPEKLTKQLKKINKYFSDFNQAPKKVINFLNKVKSTMRPVNDLLKNMTKSFYNQTEAMNKHSVAMNKARIGLINFGTRILSTTEAGKKYQEALDTMSKAEEDLAKAQEEGADGSKIAELEEAYASAKDNVPTYLKAITDALKEYKKTLISTFQSQNNMWESFDPTSGIMNPSRLFTNLTSRGNGWEQFGTVIKSLAKKGFSADILQPLVEGGLDSIGKMVTLDKLESRTALLLGDTIKRLNKQAKKAAKDGIAALGQACGPDVKKMVKSFEKTFNDGDKVVRDILKGNLGAWSEFVGKYGEGTKEFETALGHMKGLFADLTPVIDAAGKSLYGIDNISSGTSKELGELYGSVLELTEVFDITPEKCQNAAEAISLVAEKLDAYGDSVKNALELGNPFDKFEAVTDISKDQILYNVNSMRQAQVEYDQVFDALVAKGVDPAVLAKMESMGLEQGLAYGKALLSMTEEELGYVNDTVIKNMKFSEEQKVKAEKRLVEAYGEIAKAARKGAKKAFDENGVKIPLTDPSKVEEMKSDASSAGTEVGESFGEAAGQSSTYMLVDGYESGLNDAMPELKTITRNAGADVGTSLGESINTSSNTNAVASSVKYVTVNGVNQGVEEATKSTKLDLSKLFANIDNQALEPFANEIVKIISGAFETAASRAVSEFNSAVSKIRQQINQIPKEIRVKIYVDTSEIDNAINKMNQATQTANNMAQAAQKAQSASNSASSSVSSSSSTGTSSTFSRSAAPSSGTTINYSPTYYTNQSLNQVEQYRTDKANAYTMAQLLSA